MVAISIAKALIEKRDDKHLKLISLERCFWTKSLFYSMGFVLNLILNGARKEEELLFHHKIPYSIILNINQTPLKYAPVSTRTLAEKNSKHVSISGLSDKQVITATIGITFTNTYLPVQLIYGGNTSQSFPKFSFPDSFSLSANPKHFSNTAESLKLLEEIIITYLDTEQEKLRV